MCSEQSELKGKGMLYWILGIHNTQESETIEDDDHDDHNHDESHDEVFQGQRNCESEVY